jgi:hypothetical protein
MQQLKEAEKAGTSWSDMAIFYRMNSLSRVMEDALRRANVPYVMARGVEFYNRKVIKDVIAYLRVIANPADEVCAHAHRQRPPARHRRQQREADANPRHRRRLDAVGSDGTGGVDPGTFKSRRERDEVVRRVGQILAHQGHHSLSPERGEGRGEGRDARGGQDRCSR